MVHNSYVWITTIVLIRLCHAFTFSHATFISSFRSIARHQHVVLSASSSLPEPTDSNFGRRDYWNKLYENQDSFSWYSGWEELEPFVRELIPNEFAHVLIPGIGNDKSIVDMFDAGYQNITAFDYAEAGVECARKLLGITRLRTVEVLVADARDLPFEDDSFDAIFEKGTLDAIYLSGGRDKELAAKHLEMAVSEMARMLVEGGVVVSITAACVDAVQSSFESNEWKQIQDGSLYITDDGFASNNVDGTLLAWKRTSK